MDRKFVIAVVAAWALTVGLDGIAYWYFKQSNPNQDSYIGMNHYVTAMKRGR